MPFSRQLNERRQAIEKTGNFLTAEIAEGKFNCSEHSALRARLNTCAKPVISVEKVLPGDVFYNAF